MGQATTPAEAKRGQLPEAARLLFKPLRRLDRVGASILEYALGVSAAAMITVGAIIPLAHTIQDKYDEFASIINDPPVFVIRTSGLDGNDPPDGSDGSSGDGSTDGSEDGGTDGTGTGGSGETTPPPDETTPGTPDEGSTPDEDDDAEGSCGVWSHFDYGFVRTRTMVQIQVPGTVIGIHETNGNPKKKKDTQIDLDNVRPVGTAEERFVLAIEYDGVNEYFTSHNRVSIFTMSGERLLNRALVKYEEPGDIRQGDEYLVTHNHDMIIDISGILAGDKTYDETSQPGDTNVGNNDDKLWFHDIGCVIYRPAAE